jgi:hypothetical protein
MKKHRTCNKRNVNFFFAYYKTFKKEEDVPNLVQQPLSQICFVGELAIGTMTQCFSFLLKEKMKKKKLTT